MSLEANSVRLLFRVIVKLNPPKCTNSSENTPQKNLMLV